jgi:hypothetical protein
MNENTTITVSSKTYLVDSRNVRELLHQLAILNRRAAKLNVPPITLDFNGNVQVEIVTDPDTGVQVGVIVRKEAVLTGTAPKFAGWTFAATLVHTPEGNIVRTSPTFTGELSNYRNAKPTCEHCRLARNRVDTFVMAHDNGELKQVGRNCIRDFLGHTDPHWLAKLAELWAAAGELCSGDFDGEYGGSSARPNPYVRTVLAYAVMAVAQSGYVSRKAQEINERLVTTREQVVNWMFPSREELSRAAARGETWPRPTEAHYAAADAAREHCAGLEGKNDFENNLIVLSKLEAIDTRNMGLVVYMAEAHRRHVEGEALRKAANNAHFGEVGKRFKGQPVEYLGISGSFETQFGWCVIHKFRALPTGETLVWKTTESPDANTGWNTGGQYHLTATVKEHGEFREWKQTKVSRAKLEAF